MENLKKIDKSCIQNIIFHSRLVYRSIFPQLINKIATPAANDVADQKKMSLGSMCSCVRFSSCNLMCLRSNLVLFSTVSLPFSRQRWFVVAFVIMAAKVNINFGSWRAFKRKVSRRSKGTSLRTRV